jgi:hypothetical protein
MKKKFLKIVAVLTIGAVMTSCLDDDKYALDPSQAHNVIEFLDPSVPSSPAGAVYPVYSNSFSLAPSATISLTVSFSGADGNSENIELALGIDPSALAEYNYQMTNSLHGSTFDLLPEANYDMAATSVTIPAGQTRASFEITVYPETFDFSKNYALPVRILSSSSGVLSAHFSVAVLQIGVRNQYDGVYEILDGGIIRNSAAGPDAALGGDYVEGLSLDLATLSGNTVGIEPVWKDGSAVGGVVGTQFAINATTNAVTVTSSTNSALKNTPATTNTYDPATQTFVVNFGWGAAPDTRIIHDLTLHYTGPRP